MVIDVSVRTTTLLLLVMVIAGACEQPQNSRHPTELECDATYAAMSQNMPASAQANPYIQQALERARPEFMQRCGLMTVEETECIRNNRREGEPCQRAWAQLGGLFGGSPSSAQTTPHYEPQASTPTYEPVDAAPSAQPSVQFEMGTNCAYCNRSFRTSELRSTPRGLCCTSCAPYCSITGH